MIAKLAWKNLWFKPLNTVLSLVLLTASVAIISLLILLQEQFEKQFSSNIDGVDLVLGAQGSPLQLILSSVYQVDAPTGNIDYKEAEVWMKHPFVDTAIPLAFGDNYRGFKIVGTTPDYIKKYTATISEGKVFEKNFEVVIGSEIAKKLNIKLGDKFFGTHGDAEEGHVHEEYAYVVVGIASPTGKVIDNLILCTVESVWEMHSGHDHGEKLIRKTKIHPTAKKVTFMLKETNMTMSMCTMKTVIMTTTMKFQKIPLTAKKATCMKKVMNTITNTTKPKKLQQF
ncbi:ABC transporter permease [Flavobacterium piscinae]|uniref:ABC transporter permease n=1 Tax=Flavobacterium piscinae TaxID=2506424 RepID=UPI0019A51D77|nr:ABC transporter permease [Flavobacterium piscinae]MBC8884172.1 ABC transporter permease [Flavobacterium piscinae]